MEDKKVTNITQDESKCEELKSEFIKQERDKYDPRNCNWLELIIHRINKKKRMIKDIDRRCSYMNNIPAQRKLKNVI